MAKLRNICVPLESEPLEVVRQRFEVNGWDFRDVVRPQMGSTRAIFSKPEGAPDHQPFFEPSFKLR
jgi:hypothetical protein